MSSEGSSSESLLVAVQSTVELNFETQSRHRNLKSVKLKLFGLNLRCGNIFSRGQLTDSIRFTDTVQKNHEQEREHTCYVPCILNSLQSDLFRPEACKG